VLHDVLCTLRIQRELLYAFSGSNRPITSTLPLVNLINVCSIISSDRFKELYPKFHPSWNASWKIQLAIDASDDESQASEEEREDDPSAEQSAKKSKAAWEKDLKLAAKNAPPSMTLHTSNGGFNLYKRAVPLVYFCQNAFDKFAKGGQGKSWFKIDWDKLYERGIREGQWDLTDDVKIIPVLGTGEVAVVIETKVRSQVRKSRTKDKRVRDDAGNQDDSGSDSGESDASRLKGVESESSEEVSGAESEEGGEASRSGGKRKRGQATSGGKRKRKATIATPSKRRKTAKNRKRMKETYEAITSQLEPHLLPKDPYERALHLLHVGATPDTLPCREDEFVDVLMRVEEGVEGGGGGCLCKHASSSIATWS
jgi:hypothetical protein